MRHRLSEEDLSALQEWAQSSAEALELSEPTARPSDYFERRYTDPRPPDGSEVIAFSDRTFSGPANPMGVEVELRRNGDGVLSKVIFGAAFESAPGRVHGGAVSALVDDTMGYLMIVLGEAAYTAVRSRLSGRGSNRYPGLVSSPRITSGGPQAHGDFDCVSRQRWSSRCNCGSPHHSGGSIHYSKSRLRTLFPSPTFGCLFKGRESDVAAVSNFAN